MADVIKDNAADSGTSVKQHIDQVKKTEKNITISQAFKKAARWQIITTLTLSMLFLLLNVSAAVSALLGGAVALLGGFVGVLMVRSREGISPASLIVTMLKAEAIKVMVISLSLLAVFKFYNGLVPWALICGLAVAVLVSGAGLGAVGNENK